MPKENMSEIRLAKQKWEIDNSIEFEKELRKEFISESGIPIERIYTPLDLEEKGFDYLEDIGFPGQYPCTRGDTPTVYRSGLWPMSLYLGRASAEETNALCKSMVASGLNAINIVTDHPTQLGYDPGHPKAEGEVGRVGVSIASFKDFETLMNGVDLGHILLGYQGNALATVNIAEHLALAEKQGVSWKETRGYLQNEILKEFEAVGRYIFPLEHSMRLIVDSLVFCAQNAPNYSPLVVTSYHFEEKGGTPIHEIAFMLSNLIAYLQAVIDSGLEIDVIAPKILCQSSIRHIDFFGQIAKIRATRRLWARIMRERFNAKNPSSLACRMQLVQGGVSVYREQCLNNIARSAIAVLAGTLVGANRIEPRTYVEAFGIPSEEASRIALRTQQIVGYETGVCDTIDPLAGSYFIESLTAEFEERTMGEIEAVDRMGGVVNAIEQGYIQRVLARDGYEKEKDRLAGRIVRVGVNRFRSDEQEERPIRVYRADPKFEERRIGEIEKLRRERDNQRVIRALDNLKAVASKPRSADNNLMPFIMEAVKKYATRGEIADALRDVWGECPERAIL